MKDIKLQPPTPKMLESLRKRLANVKSDHATAMIAKMDKRIQAKPTPQPVPAVPVK